MPFPVIHSEVFQAIDAEESAAVKLQVNAAPFSALPTSTQKLLEIYYAPLIDTQDMLQASGVAKYGEAEESSPMINNVPESIFDLWRLMKEFRWEGLVMLLKVGPQFILNLCPVDLSHFSYCRSCQLGV